MEIDKSLISHTKTLVSRNVDAEMIKLACEDILGKSGGALSIAVSCRWLAHRAPQKQSRRAAVSYLGRRGGFMFKLSVCLFVAEV